MPQPVTLSHPLAAHHVTVLRAESTGSETFRATARRLTTLLTVEATRDLPLQDQPVVTPLTETTGKRITARIAVVPILRAGLAMVPPFLDLFPDAEVRHLGFFRDEETLQPVEYYNKLPEGDPVDTAFVTDPMLATGGSAIAAVAMLRQWGVRDIRFLGLIAAPEGLAALQAADPEVAITVAACDSHLNEQGYIVPGLGDAGDRVFNT